MFLFTLTDIRYPSNCRTFKWRCCHVAVNWKRYFDFVGLLVEKANFSKCVVKNGTNYIHIKLWNFLKIYQHGMNMKKILRNCSTKKVELKQNSLNLKATFGASGFAGLFTRTRSSNSRFWQPMKSKLRTNVCLLFVTLAKHDAFSLLLDTHGSHYDFVIVWSKFCNGIKFKRTEKYVRK